MLGKLLPILLSLVALIGGAVGGELLRGAPPPPAAVAAPDQAAPAELAAPDLGPQAEPPPATTPREAAPVSAAQPEPQDASAPAAWFKFPQQFFVPVLHGGRLDSTMILALSVEMPETATEEVYAHEIKLRDALLRQLLIHANTGGFDGNFTTEAHLKKLRGDLTATAQAIVPRVREVLIGDIARQER
ncbi:hypothetical protein [Paracoccus alkenifer]|uniref:Flagellar protein FliL n=1 Tax=Paracoccus alkenifer TaxID=65735 RepID=A0A1H6JN65_9RHOB|nr:hypothetical protein [Paracoccus alkenifer]SEH61226.1 hypothetical protein SAMN04488075_0357 [Paracoccus alkenifer]